MNNQINFKIDNSICEKVINAYGKINQLDMVMEESAELIKAINKYKRKRFTDDETNAINDIIEESADVIIMIAQICGMFNCYDKLQNKIEEKTLRLNERLKDEDN